MKKGGETCAEKRGKRDYRSDKSQYLDEGWRGIPGEISGKNKLYRYERSVRTIRAICVYEIVYEVLLPAARETPFVNADVGERPFDTFSV